MRKNEEDKTRKEKKILKTSAVLFMENTKDGELAKDMRKVMRRVENILGYRIKIIERTTM